jgi:GT2 family glycosyltransferase
VVVCAYTEERWSDLAAAVASIERQTVAALETIVACDHSPGLLARVREHLPGVKAIENTQPRGLAGARNCGVAAARGDVIAFLDDDAEADPRWLERLLAAYERPDVAGVGGGIEPLWLGGKPAAFPEEFNWIVGCSYRGLPTERSRVRNMIGANMSLRREVLEQVGGFRPDMGRLGKHPVGCEETELCIRVQQQRPESFFVYEPQAMVRHRVPETRTGWRYFGARCYAEGLSKALVARHVGTVSGLESERSYAVRTLPIGVLRGVKDAFRGDLGGLARASAIVLGLLVTTAGYAVGTLGGALGRGEPGRDPAPAGDASREDARWIEFDIHGAAAFRVAAEAPAAPQLEEMFGPFRAGELGRHDLTVTAQPVPLEGAVKAEEEYEYTETGVNLRELKVQVLVEDGGFKLNGSREMLTFALPLIDRVLVTHDVAMIHAATVDYRGHGICMPAWGGTGKTSTIAKLLELDGYAFMGDDWGFLSGDGRLLGYQKPMLIKPYHKELYPHLFSKRSRKPLVPPALSSQAARLATLVHPLVTQYPRLARVGRRLSPEHMTVTPKDAFPKARFSSGAPLACAMFVERIDGPKTVFEERDKGWMVSRLVGNFHAGISHHSQEIVTALAAAGLVPLEQAFGEKAAVLERGLEGKPVYLLQVPASLSAHEASDVIVEHIQNALAHIDT